MRDSSGSSDKPVQRNWRKKLFNFGKLFVFGSILFAGGWAVGSGRIELPSKSFSSQNQDLPADLDYAAIEEVYDALRKSYDGKLTKEALLDGLKSGLAQASGDPYTEYLNAKEAKEFNEDLSGSFTGIGAQLGKNDRGNVIVVSPIDGFPAKKAGLRPNDVIVEVNGEDATSWSIEKAVDNIRGPAGSVVKLRLIRGETKDITVEITRAEITIPSVESEVLAGNIGYLKISQFGDDTVRLARQAAEDFRSKNVGKVILDLRGNPGGYLNGAVDVASLWLNSGQTVLEEKRGGVVIETYRARGNAVLNGIPTVVLIDEGSASASEIVAGALSDHGAATLMGQTSFGKGSVQQPQILDAGGLLKVTIARWYTPKGQNIDKEGIKPNREVKISDKDAESGRDPQKDAALEYLE